MSLMFGAATIAQDDTHDHSGGASHDNPAATEEVPDHIHGDIIYGSPDAPVEIIEYASMTCPHCKSFNDTVMPYLLEELIPQGKVRLVFRNFVRDRADIAVAVLSRCTTDVNVSKKMIDAYFDQQHSWLHSQNIGPALQAIAMNSGGLTFDDIRACGSSRAIATHLIEMQQEGMKQYQIESIPTIILNGTKVKFKGFEELRNKIELATIGK